MEQLACALEEAGYCTFLPQRDGLELTGCVESLVANGLPQEEAGRLMSRAIFALDVYQVLWGCGAVVANLNGRVPDEGTVAEAAMAWSRGKPVVGYKADSRTAFGGQDNPLVAGLFEFELLQSIDEVVAAVAEALKNSVDAEHLRASRDHEIDGYTGLGKQIAEALAQKAPLQEIVEVILRFASATLKSVP